MRLGSTAIVTLLAIAGLAAQPGPARACGFGEAPGDCGQTAESDARYLLLRATTALSRDNATALRQFARGEGGFRTQDAYVFCVDPQGVMSAHPSPILQGHDVRDLHDQTGNYFIATMMRTAMPGKVSEIRYLFPRPGGTVAVPKTTYYTRAGDQVCGVGVYDGEEAAPAQPALSRRDRMAQLRSRLDAAMPPALRSDWAAYQDALSEQTSNETAAIDKAREQVEAAQTTLAALK